MLRFHFSHRSYYMDGSKAKAENFLNPSTLDNFKHLAIDRSKEALSKASKGTHTTWVLETSSAYGGGAHVLSESFIAGFTYVLYLKKNQSNTHSFGGCLENESLPFNTYTTLYFGSPRRFIPGARIAKLS